MLTMDQYIRVYMDIVSSIMWQWWENTKLNRKTIAAEFVKSSCEAKKKKRETSFSKNKNTVAPPRYWSSTPIFLTSQIKLRKLHIFYVCIRALTAHVLDISISSGWTKLWITTKHYLIIWFHSKPNHLHIRMEAQLTYLWNLRSLFLVGN